MALSPEERRRIRSETMSKLHSDPEFREQRRQGMLGQHQDPEFRRKLIESGHTPEVEAKRTESIRAAWERPETRERHLAGLIKERVCAACGLSFLGPNAARRCPECRKATELINKWKTVAQLVARDGINCHLCKEPVDLFVPGNAPRGASIDHVIASGKGGSDEFSNLALAHFSCNWKKGCS